MKKFQRRRGQSTALVLVGAVALVGVVFSVFWAWPRYAVYSSTMAGEAEYAQASYNRRIAVQEAQAKMDAAKLLAQAEVERAKGVAQANQIVSSGLGGPEGYLRYLYINNLENSHDQIIYVPTEAGLPILEANRLRGQPLSAPATPPPSPSGIASHTR